MNDFDDDFVSGDDMPVGEITPPKPFWRCEECGHKDHKKPMPADRVAFYRGLGITKDSPKCPKCKSVGFMPVGY